MKATVVEHGALDELHLRLDADDDLERFQEGAAVVIVRADEEPDLARMLEAVTWAKRARKFHEELRSGDGGHAENVALDLLVGEEPEDR